MSNSSPSGCGCGCAHAHPIDVLKEEHRVIEVVLDAITAAAQREPIDVPLFRDAIDFLRNFADGCHHAKEENQLFPQLESVGVPREGGPIGCMLDEHTQGRALIRGMSAGLDEIARGVRGGTARLRAATSGYVQLLRTHIWKEDHVLFEMARQRLSPAELGALRSGFDQLEQSEGERHERYIQLAKRVHERAYAPAAAEARP